MSVCNTYTNRNDVNYFVLTSPLFEYVCNVSDSLVKWLCACKLSERSKVQIHYQENKSE